MPFFLVATHPTEPRQRIEGRPEQNVGSVAGNDLILSGADQHHARILHRDGRYIITDLKTDEGTWVNGRRIPQATIFREIDTVTIGPWTVRTEYVPEPQAPFAGRTDRERELVAALLADSTDDELRQVYSDWLEENGFRAEAETMLLERKLALENAAVQGRLRVVASFTDIAWRMLVTRAAVEGPPHAPTCPARWDLLLPSDHPARRHCPTCQRPVYFIESADDVPLNARRGRFVVVDPTAAR